MHVTHQTGLTSLHSSIMPGDARSSVERAHKTIETEMLAAIPWPEVPLVAGLKHPEWHVCHVMLRLMRRGVSSEVLRNGLFKRINKQWTRAIRTMIAATRNHYARHQRTVTRQGSGNLPFYSNPTTWSSNLGFDTSASDTWILTRHHRHEVGTQTCKEYVSGYPQQALSIGEWSSANDQQRLSIIAARIHIV